MRPGEAFADLIFSLGMATTCRSARNRLVRAAENPGRVQERTLREILDACRNTEFGKANKFSSLQSADAFRSAVPIHDYESLRPLIERQIATGTPSLAPTRPLLYARTSGTTGLPKLIPVTERVVDDLKRAQRAMAYAQHDSANAFAGRILAIGGPVCEDILSDGSIAGSISGLIYKTMPRFVRAKYVLPAEVFAITDISTIATANPSTILRLLDQIHQDLPTIAREISEGTCTLLERLPPALASALKSKIATTPRTRAMELLASPRTPPTLGELWPDLRAIVTWLGGGCAVSAETVNRLIPAATKMIDFGYVASEMRGTIVVDVDRKLALPLLEDVFFEFVPLASWNEGSRKTILVQALEEGRDYHVIVTTFGGLVRYQMNDVVRAGPSIANTPTFDFVRKGRGVTSLTGEKLSEDQVIAAMTSIGRRIPSPPSFYVFLAEADRGGYRAFIEFSGLIDDCKIIQTALDEELRTLNIEYASKRASGRLKSLTVVPLARGTSNAYRKHCVQKGQRESQLKVLTLQNADECDFDFQAHILHHDHVTPRLH
jgi:hypothetical protein